MATIDQGTPAETGSDRSPVYKSPWLPSTYLSLDADDRAMAAAAELSEPEVLAHTKRRLFPEEDARGTYAVVDTQFASEEWLAGQRISEDVREVLAPFNHVRVGSGYPDLVGVRRLESELLGVELVGEDATADPPLIAIEAKGVAGGSVDTGRAVVQAHDRLGEANVAFAAVPARAVTETDRTLARELNVGVLGVDSGGGVEPLEVPRVVGNRTTDAASAIRFQASAQGVADQSFGLNHPKNYLGYPLAHYVEGETRSVVEEWIVGAVEEARKGAAFLGLIEERPRGVVLTELGREVVRFAKARYDSVAEALAEFEAWQGTTKRFYEEAPLWGEVARRVVYEYPATKLLVEELQVMQADDPEPSLVDLAEWMHVQHPSFAVELFIRGDPGVRERVLTKDGEAVRREVLRDGGVYHAPTVFQLKAMLYHAGVVTERGKEPNRLAPAEDVWALCETA